MTPDEPQQDRKHALLRFTGTTRRDPRIEAWFSSFADPYRLMARPWFEAMRTCGADVRELFHDSCPIACVGDAPFGYVNAYKAHAAVGFFHGTALADPEAMLQGTGKHMRHVKLAPGKDVDGDALRALISAAHKDIQKRLAEIGVAAVALKGPITTSSVKINRR